jgi:hypothetical protein
MPGKYSGVPISWNEVDYKDDPTKIFLNIKNPVKSSSSTMAFGIGYTLGTKNAPVFLDVEFDYSSGKFSDWRVHNRKISYYNFGINIGYAPYKEIPGAVYVAIGAAWLKQSEYVDAPGYMNMEWNESDYLYHFECLDQSEGPGYAGIGLKVAIIKQLVLRSDFRFYMRESGNESNIEIINENPSTGPKKPNIIGSRLTIGLEICL